MTYLSYCLKVKGITNSPIYLQTLIDDGISKIKVLPSEKHRIDEMIDFIDDMYKFFSLKVSWDKTFVSRKLCMYLNEIYINKVQI
jgi:hypothetical protein